MMPFHFFAAGTLTLGYKQYELSNHLGNVLTTIADNVIKTTPSGAGLLARIVSTQDYYPFGMGMVERAYQEPNVNNERNYRYGFNGMERDSEWGEGMYDFEARTLDVRLGRFLSVDRKQDLFPFASSYAYCLNNPLLLVDTSGEYPKSTAVQMLEEEFNVKISPLAAGVIDGLIQDNVAKALWDLGTALLTEEGRAQVGEMVAAIAADPVQFVKQMVQDEVQKYKNIASLNDDGLYAIGKSLGGKAADLITGGIAGVAGKFMKALTKGRKVDIDAPEVTVPPKNGKTRNPNVDCACFLAGTMVKVPEGEKPVEELKENDLVLAYDEKTGKNAYKRITKVHLIHEPEKIYHLYINQQVIKVTGKHPFFLQGKWVEVQYLHKGDSVTLYTGKKAVIDSIAIIKGAYTVYNFTIEEFSTYYVSPDGVLVHNCNGKVLAQNKANSKLSEEKVKNDLTNSLQNNEELLVKPRIYINDGSGNFAAPDFAVVDKTTGKFKKLVDAKDGNAELTTRQKALNEHGGTFKGTKRTKDKKSPFHKKNVSQGGIQVAPKLVEKVKTNFSGKGS
jgi:RHS repeat-associated protein